MNSLYHGIMKSDFSRLIENLPIVSTKVSSYILQCPQTWNQRVSNRYKHWSITHKEDTQNLE